MSLARLRVLLLILLVSIIKVEAVLVGSQFMYKDDTNPQCSGKAFFEFPFTLGDICFDSDFNPSGNSIIFDCESKAQKSYNGKGCKADSIVNVQSGCQQASPGISYKFDCLDVPANQLLVIEAGLSCEGNAIKNRTQVSVVQLNTCFVNERESFKAYQSGEVFRLEFYNNTECINGPDTQLTGIYINNRCTSELRLDGTTSIAFFAQRADVSPILGNSALKQTYSASLIVCAGILLISILNL